VGDTTQRHALRPLPDEGGFTLVEVLTVIVIMGILLGIATVSWFSLVERNRVISGANQVAADLRLAHNSASNQLTSWEVRTTAGGNAYQLARASSPPTTRTLPSGTVTVQEVTLRFTSDGRVESVAGGSTVTVAAQDGSPARNIEVNQETSRVRVVP
jgi:prepilin-type N-terminal cleavage/methylation domain-containing protein